MSVMGGSKNRVMVWAATLFLTAVSLRAAPFAKTIQFQQPDGTQVELWGEGDEFHAVFEHNEYTVVFDPVRKAYVYARLSANGAELIPTRLEVGKADPEASGLPKHLRITPESRQAKVRTRFEKWDAGMEITARWAEQKAERRQYESQIESGITPLAPPNFTVTGTKVGLCLLIDFDDNPATIPQAEIINFCNGDNYTGYGNNGSVKKYFQDNSNNLLTYTNVVTAYIRMAQPKSFYNDTSQDAGSQGNLLIRDALNILKALPNYATEILPAFESLTVDGNNRVTACNVFYAGGNGGVWSMGLWPHSWSLYEVGQQELSTGGKKVFRYQITNIGSSLRIATFCHENGHMLCGYPDLYDYDYDSSGGAGNFCLMGYGGGNDANPVQFCAYLKRASGWATTVNFTEYTWLPGTLVSALGQPDFNKFYRYQKPGTPTEYYLIENRQKAGRDAHIPGGGIAIWHIDELGNRDDQRLAYNALHQNFECTLVCADNQWHMHRDPNTDDTANAGDAQDLYYAGNTAPSYGGVFSDTSAPSARWWDGSMSNIELRNFSASGTVMTFIQPDPVPPTIISPDVLPSGRIGTYYSYAFLATGGATPYVWQIISGATPDGITFTANGLLSGMPETAGTVQFEVVVTSASGLADTNLVSLTINPPYGIPYAETFETLMSHTLMPDGWTQVSVSNNIPWGFVNGNGMTLQNPREAYSGSRNARLIVESPSLIGSKTRLVSPWIVFDTPTAYAQLSFRHYMQKKDNIFQDTVRVLCRPTLVDEWQEVANFTAATGVWTKRTVMLPGPLATCYIAFEGTARLGYGVHIDDVEIADATPPPFGFSTSSPLPDAVVGQPYSFALEAANGVEPYTFNWVSGTLPPGLGFAAGVISGTATAVGSGTFTVEVVDDASGSTTGVFTVNAVLPRAGLFVETFEYGGVIPPGWRQEYSSGQLQWAFRNGGGNADTFRQPASAYEGYYNAVLWVDSTSNHTTRLISPAINLGAAPNDPRLTFWHCMRPLGANQDQLRVYYRPSNSGAWTFLAAYTNPVLDWTQQSLALPEPSTNYYLAFEGTAQFGHGVCIDDVRVTDGSLAPIIVTHSPLPPGTVGVPYSKTLVAVGGVEPYAWSLISGTLPAGMSLSAGGALSGTPTGTRDTTLAIRVSGANGFASTNLFPLTVTNVRKIPYAENFESRRALPLGWSEEYVYGTSSFSWQYANGNTAISDTPAAAQEGTNNAVFVTFSTTGYKTRLILPILDMGVGSTNIQLSFWLCMAKKTNQDELKVLYKTNENESVWSELAYFKNNIPAWTNVVLDIPNPTPRYVIAFEGYARNGKGVAIDDVQILGDRNEPISAYDQWKLDMFGLNADDDLVAGNDADPDGDGIPNWLEYAYGLDPMSADGTGVLPTGGVVAGYLTLSYREGKAATDVLFEVEACDNLLSPFWTTVDVSEYGRDDSNTWWQVFMRHDVPVTNAPQRFLRLKVSMP